MVIYRDIEPIPNCVSDSFTEHHGKPNPDSIAVTNVVIDWDIKSSNNFVTNNDAEWHVESDEDK